MLKPEKLRIFGYDASDLPGTAKVYKRHGISSVVGHADLKAAEFFSANGFEYFIMQGCFHTDEHTDRPENLCVDVNGNVTKWFGSACPNSPAAIDKCLTEARGFANIPGISGIIIDGARYASPASPENADAFYTCFCQRCLAKMAELGYDPALIKASVLALYTHRKTGQGFDTDTHRLGIDQWLAFRRSIITSHLTAYAKAIRDVNPNLLVGMYLFTPSLSALVGQNYHDLAEVFDFLSPMIYRQYQQPEGPACLDHEIAALLRTANHLTPAQKKPVYALYASLTGLPFNELPDPERLLAEGCPVSFVENEVKKAREWVGSRLEVSPIIMLEDSMLAESIQACLRQGVKTLDFFLYEKAAFERYFPDAFKAIPGHP